MARVHFVKSARKKNPVAKKGESYYWWQHRFRPKQFSKDPPKRSATTQSSFNATLWDIEDDSIAGAVADDSLAGTRDEVVSALQGLHDECESNLQNMPDHLQESSQSGQTLQERINALESAISEFEDLELDEPNDDDLDVEELTRGEGESDKDFEARKAAEVDSAKADFWQGKLDEFNAISVEV